MAELENKGTDVPGEQTGQAGALPDYTEAEQRAMEKGWKPKEDYDGEPENFRSAELFLQLDPLYKKLETISRENKNLKEATQYLTKLQKETKANEFNRALAELKHARRVAQENGDFERSELLEEKMDVVKEQKRIVEAIPVTPQNEPSEFVDWQKRNGWYEKDEDLRDWADGRGVKLHQQGKTPSEVLEILESEVKRKFKDKVSNPNRERASSVEGSTGGNSAASRKGKYELNDMELKVANTLMKSGIIKNIDEYVTQLQTAK